MNDSLTFAQAITDFHFLRPLWLIALLPALFFVRRLWHLDAQGTAWHKVIDQSLLPYLLNSTKNTSQRLPLYMLMVVWTLAVLALAGPTWSKQTQPVQQRQDALVIVLDLTLGMFANDFEPNRITVARRKIMDILDARTEGQTALVVYGGEAHLVTPLTDDSISIRALVPALNPNIMPVIGNNPGHAVQMARQLMNEAAAVNGRILLLTAGIPPEQNNAIWDSLNDGRYPLSIIGIGSTQGAPIPAANGDYLRDSNGQMVVSTLNRDNLITLTAQLNGRYQDISIDNADIEFILAESLMADADSYLEADEEVELWYDAGPWLLLLLVPLCALCFRRGWILQLAIIGGALLLVSPPQPAWAQQTNTPIPLSDDGMSDEMMMNTLPIGSQPGQAVPAQPKTGFDIRSLWLNRDQRGLRAMEEEDPVTAAVLFENSAWRGAANYRAGNYSGAIAEFSLGDDLDSKFNLGNALAFAERFEESIAAYQSVLDLQPDHADALKNKEIVEKLLEEQQQQEQEEQQQEQQEQEEQQEQQAEDEEGEQQEASPEEEEQEPQDPQESEEQEPTEQQEESENDNANSQQRANTEVEEDQESLEQFLRRIEDDPGELLQRKFQFESRRRMIERRAASQVPR
ncbi:VWA domain-containing protein [Gammaproteobacteria bacterium LSUCC0112]|nr:VWA domain-containing protein [Gammaproteobacteria bacterium LSUCC0112]